MVSPHEHSSLASLFKAVVKHSKSIIALQFDDGTHITFEQLDKRSDQLAIWLTKKGLAFGDTIAIFHDKSVNCYVLMLAAIKLGIVYSNIDWNNPGPRLSSMLDTLQPKFIFDCTETLEKQISLGAQQLEKRLNLETAVIECKRHDANDFAINSNLNLSSSLYVVFTSGSTGSPKGALMTQGNILSMLSWIATDFNFSQTDRFTGLNPAYFDNSVFDFYASIFNGATLCPIRTEKSDSPNTLVEAIKKLNCTVWFSVPSLLVYLLTTRSINQSQLKSIRYFIFGGEGFSKPFLKQLYDLYNDTCQLINVYGPSECSCICSHYKIDLSDFQQLDRLAPLGHITKNFDYKILDPQQREATTGELYLSGAGVGNGYYNAPEKTKESFVSFIKNKNTIYYRTGDLVEQDEKGLVHFKGRSDNQIKHMGYRIELEEIESVINSLPNVEQCLVVYRKTEIFAGLIEANVIIKDSLSIEKTEQSIMQSLPRYMRPKTIKFVDSLPKNRNGKLDRKQLVGS